jgi:hypothetical protein
VFDTASRRIVGLMGIDQNATLQNGCVDDGTGRFYVKTGNTNPVAGSQVTGFLIGESRATESPYPQVQGYPSLLNEGFISSISCDSARHQVIALEDPGKLIVLQDHTPTYTLPPALGDPDAATSGGPYDPATSTLAYEGDGRGFGAQVRLVGGYNGLGADFSGTRLSDRAAGPVTVGSLVSPNSPKATLGATGLPDSPQNVTLSDSQATAAAQGIARDGGLQADMSLPAAAISQLENQGGGGPPPPSQLQDPWAYPVIACASSPGEQSKTDAATGSQVSCDPDSLQAAASAEASSPAEIPGVLRVVGAGSSVTSQLDKKTGVLTTTTKTWAKAVSIDNGAIELENAVATAVTEAGGQAGTAKSKYTRSIGQLSINGQVVCAPCDPGTVASAINTNPYTQPTVRAVVPAPAGAPTGDTKDYEWSGTAKGAQASVVRAPDLQMEDQAVNEQSAYDQEVPALRLELGNNSLQHVDLIVDLAAPQAFSRLDIQQCFTCSGDTSADSTTATTDVPPAADVQPPPPEDTQAEAAPVDEAPRDIGPPPGAVGFSPALASFSQPHSSAPSTVGLSTPRGAARGNPSPLRGALGQLGGGLRAALTSPTKFFELLMIWAVMAIPVYLAARRRLVVDYILGPTQEIS